MTRKLTKSGVQYRKNQTTGLIEVFDEKIQDWKVAKFIGYNFNCGDEFHQFESVYSNVSVYDSPSLHNYLMSLMGSRPDTNLVSTAQNMGCNSERVYLPNQASALDIHEDGTNNAANISMLDFGSDVLFIPKLWAQNIQVSDIPTTTFTNLSGFSYDYRPLIFDEATMLPSNKGRLAGYIAFKPVVGISQATLDTVQITISGTITSVGGSAATNYIIQATGGNSNLKVRRARALIGFRISDEGSGYTSTSMNKGFADVSFPLLKWYWTGTTSSDSRVVPTVLGRISQYNNIVVAGLTNKNIFNGDTSNQQFDYYNNENKFNLTQDRAGINDFFILDGGENMPNEDYEARDVFMGVAGSSNWFDRLFNNASYVYDGEGFNRETRKMSSLPVKYSSFEQLEQIFKLASLRGVHLTFNLWDGRHPYNSGGFAKSQLERFREFGYYLVEWETQMHKMLTWLDELSAKYNVSIKVLLANESNLDYTMSGRNYSLGDTAVNQYGQVIFWWDPANPTNKQLNLEKQLAYYNRIIERYKKNNGNRGKLLFGYVAQYASGGQATEIEALISGGFMDNFDFIGNNYYGSFSTTEPWKSRSGVDNLTRYINFFNAQTDVKKKLPMLLTECGIPAKVFLVPKTLNVGTGVLPVIYNGTTATFWWNGTNVTNQVVVVDNINDRADLIKNLIIWIKDKPAIMGVQHFGIVLQNGRSQKLQYMQWESFNCPFPSNAPNGVTSATHDVFFDEYWMGDLNYPVIDNNQYGGLHKHPMDSTETTSILTACTTTIRNTINTEYTGADSLVYAKI